jgi:hypothetical protein
LTRKIGVSIAGSLTLLCATLGFSTGVPRFEGGVQMGYTYGQNGVGFPSFGKNPLGNPGRAGFYLSQLRLKSTIDFDSSFSGVAVGNIYTADIGEVYLEKRFRNYTFRAGKFRGAGLKSGSGTDEFERVTINAPRYARLWSYFKRVPGNRDFGIEAQGLYLGGDLKQRLFFHNANRENVFNEEPSTLVGPVAQATGFDYAIDWRISPFSVWGATLGALAGHEWDEFIGKADVWRVDQWMRTNPVVDGSVNHQMDVGRFHLFNEGMVLIDRTTPNPADGGNTKFWGVSSMIRFDATRLTTPFVRYEFCDPSDGAFGPDNLHIFTFGAAVHPSPASHPGLKVTTQYVRSYEEGLTNSLPNDLFISQLEMVF